MFLAIMTLLSQIYCVLMLHMEDTVPPRLEGFYSIRMGSAHIQRLREDLHNINHLSPQSLSTVYIQRL